jgi:PadR family transcriptional regulator, regulatory protein PadR
MKGEALKGHLDLLLLAALQRQPAHGYAVVEELRALSDGTFDLPEGTIYPALHRLEHAGLLQSTWTRVKGRPRRTYDLTERGRAALQEQQRAWVDFAAGVNHVLARTAWSNPA